MKSGNLASLLQGFFTERLMHQRRASPHTIASYRDTFRLLLGYAQQQLRKAPTELAIENLDAPFISAFLNYIEKDRGVTARSRNVRLAGIHSFFRYVALERPDHAAVTQRVLAIPTKRYTRRQVEFLSAPEVDALLAAPDRNRWTGRRDHALLLLAIQTGLRCSELIALRPFSVGGVGLQWVVRWARAVAPRSARSGRVGASLWRPSGGQPCSGGSDRGC
jgi:site-specific recombinase XerD